MLFLYYFKHESMHRKPFIKPDSFFYVSSQSSGFIKMIFCNFTFVVHSLMKVIVPETVVQFFAILKTKPQNSMLESLF